MSNFQKHIGSCWGRPALKAVVDCANLKDARRATNDIKNTASITAAFKRKGKGKVTYLHRQHMKTETK